MTRSINMENHERTPGSVWVFWIIVIGIVCLLQPQYDGFDQKGKASWYSRSDRGVKKTTASGEIFDDQAMTAAMPDIELGRKVKVVNLKNGKSVIVTINDRGPHGRYVKSGRIIDLTKAAFKKISKTRKGLIRVGLVYL